MRIQLNNNSVKLVPEPFSTLVIKKDDEVSVSDTFGYLRSMLATLAEQAESISQEMIRYNTLRKVLQTVSSNDLIQLKDMLSCYTDANSAVTKIAGKGQYLSSSQVESINACINVMRNLNNQFAELQKDLSARTEELEQVIVNAANKE